MTHFAHPEVLWFLVIPVTMAFWEWIRKGQALVMPVDHRPHRKHRWISLFVHTANMIPAILLGVAILLLARPMTSEPPETERRATNIEIVLDLSGSMNAPFGQQDVNAEKPRRRVDAAMDAIEAFVDLRKGDSFGLTVYGTWIIDWVPLTRDTSAISHARPFMSGFLAATRTLTALDAAADKLGNTEDGDRMIVLITDGNFNREHDPAKQAEDLLIRFEEENIVCYGVFTRSSPVPHLEEQICRESGGGLFNIKDELEPDSLEEVFKLIDEMTPAKMKYKEPRSLDHHQPFIIPALCLLFLHILSLIGLRYTPW